MQDIVITNTEQMLQDPQIQKYLKKSQGFKNKLPTTKTPWETVSGESGKYGLVLGRKIHIHEDETAVEAYIRTRSQDVEHPLIRQKLNELNQKIEKSKIRKDKSEKTKQLKKENDEKLERERIDSIKKREYEKNNSPDAIKQKEEKIKNTEKKLDEFLDAINNDISNMVKDTWHNNNNYDSVDDVIDAVIPQIHDRYRLDQFLTLSNLNSKIKAHISGQSINLTRSTYRVQSMSWQEFQDLQDDLDNFDVSFNDYKQHMRDYYEQDNRKIPDRWQ